MFQRKVNSALLIDFDNILGSLGRPFIDSIPRWMAWLEDGKFDEKARKRVFAQRRVYWNTQYDVHTKIFQNNGFEVIPCPSRVKRNKSTADMIIALDAYQSSQQSRRIKEYVVLTIDTDFVPLLDRLAEQGKATVAVANKDTMKVVADHADIVIPISALGEAISYQRAKRSLLDLFKRKPAPSGENGAAAAPAAKASASELSAVAAQVAEMAARSPGMPIGKEAVVRALRRAVPGFRTAGGARYLGFESYPKLMGEIVKLRPDLRLIVYGNGGIAIISRAEE